MSHVFISYSRANRDFVVQLHDALKKAGSETWVDWEDIPKSAEFMTEIQQGIIATDAFIFVISHASATSRICGLEINFAAGNNKRIIPIVCEEVERERLPKPIGDRNWIFARAEDDFAAALQELIRTIEVDLEWVRSHSRLLNRAHEWKAAAKEQSLLLRGWDLEDAERWLVKGGAHEPFPTALQENYIACGRWASRLDEASMLYRQSLLYSNRNRYQTACAYLVRALELAPPGSAPDGFPSSEDKPDWAEEAWLQFRHQDRKRGRLRTRFVGHQGPVSCVALSPDNTIAVSGGFDGSMKLWTVETGALLLNLDGHEGAISAIVFSPDGKIALSGSEDGRVLVWDLASGKADPLFPGATDPATALAFDGKRAAIGLRTGVMVVFDREAQKALLHAVPHSGAVTFLRFAPENRILTASAMPVIGEWLGDGSILSCSIDDGKQQLILPGTLDSTRCITIDPTGQRALRGLGNGVVEMWNLESGKLINNLSGHQGAVTAVAFFPEGKTALSCGDDKTIRVWDLATGKEQRVWDGHLDTVTGLSVSTDGNIAFSASLDHTIAVWDAAIASEMIELDAGGSVGAIVVSPDGKRVAIGSKATVQIWNPETLEPIARFQEGHTDSVESLAFSADGATIASGAKDRTIRLWNAENGHELSLLVEGGETVTGVQLSPDGATLISASGNRFREVMDKMAFGAAGGRLPSHEPGAGLVLLWDLKSKFGWPLERHSRAVGAVAIDAAAERVVTGSEDGSVRVWDARNGRQIRLLTGNTSAIRSVTVTPDGQTVASGSKDGSIRVWAVESSTPPSVFSGHTSEVTGLALSADGRVLISVSPDRTVRFWDVAAGQPSAVADDNLLETAVAISPDNSFAITASYDHVLRIWDVSGRRQVHELKGHTGPVWGVAISRDGGLALSVSEDGTVGLWDLPNRVQLHAVNLQRGPLSDAAFGADGAKIIVQSSDGMVVLWDMQVGQPLRVFASKDYTVSRMAVTSDGNMLACAPGRGLTAVLWDTESGNAPRGFHGRSGDALDLCCNADGSIALVACADGSVRVWDLSLGRELPPLEGHTAAVTSVAIHSERKIAVSGSMDGTVQVWDLKTGRQQHVLIGHNGPVVSVAVTPDGRAALSASGDNTVRLWDLKSGNQIDVLPAGSPGCLAINPRDHRAWIGSFWHGKVRVWNLLDPRTPLAPPRLQPEHPTNPAVEFESIQKSVGLRVSAGGKLETV